MMDSEIKKALECCSKRTIWEDCPIDCPMYQFDGDCFDLMQKDILDLINRQQAHIEQLKENIDGLKIGKANIIRDIQFEAIKEFLKRLKPKADYYENGEGWEGDIYYADDIEETYKEMVGDAE